MVSYVTDTILTDTRHIFLNVYSLQQFLYAIHSQLSVFRAMSPTLQAATQFFCFFKVTRKRHNLYLHEIYLFCLPTFELFSFIFPRHFVSSLTHLLIIPISPYISLSVLIFFPHFHFLPRLIHIFPLCSLTFFLLLKVFLPIFFLSPFLISCCSIFLTHFSFLSSPHNDICKVLKGRRDSIDISPKSSFTLIPQLHT